MVRTLFPRFDSARWGSWGLLRYIRQSIGVSDKMPADFHGEFVVDGVRVVVYPTGFTPTSRGCIPRTGIWRNGRTVTAKVACHRVYADIGGGRLVPVGRLHQVKGGK